MFCRYCPTESAKIKLEPNSVFVAGSNKTFLQLNICPNQPHYLKDGEDECDDLFEEDGEDVENGNKNEAIEMKNKNRGERITFHCAWISSHGIILH